MRAARLVALATGLGAGVGACGNAPSSATNAFGDVMMTVTVPDDTLIRTADYTIESDDMSRARMTGTMGGTQALHQVQKLFTHVPVGDYVASARAEATDHQSVCEGSLPVKVTKGAIARVHVAAMCRGSGGHVVVGIGVNCHATPLVDFLVSPVSAHVGEVVVGRASPLRQDGGALTYAWTAPSGTFADAKASQTAFTCALPGPVEVSLKVTDAEGCAQSHSAMVTCLAVPDGGLDARDGGADVTVKDAADASDGSSDASDGG